MTEIHIDFKEQLFTEELCITFQLCYFYTETFSDLNLYLAETLKGNPKLVYYVTHTLLIDNDNAINIPSLTYEGNK